MTTEGGEGDDGYRTSDSKMKSGGTKAQEEVIQQS